MTPTNDILIELQEVAPRLAQLQRISAFRVPANYFEQLPNRITDDCREATELAQAAPTLWAMPKYTAFDTPTGYFKWLYDEIMHQTTGKVSGNTEIPQFNTAMSVPDAYFDQLHDNILAKVRALSTNNAPAESQQHGKDEELADYPQLQSLRQSRAFAVPANYFETSRENIIQQSTQKQQGRLIQMQQWWSNLQPVARYAAVIAIFVAGYLISSRNDSEQHQNASIGLSFAEIDRMLDDLPTAEIGSYVRKMGYIDDLSDEDILASVDTQTLNKALTSLDGISSADIKNYVNELPNEFDQILDKELEGIDLDDLEDLDLADLPDDLP